VNKSLALSVWIFAAACSVSPLSAFAQQSRYEQFRAHNYQMRSLQPSWIGPLIQSDARLGQFVNLSVANQSIPGGHPIVYGNNHGVGFIFDRRFQVAFQPPSFFRNHSAQSPDGFGNASVMVKARIVSGNAEHGNYIVTAILNHGFAPRAAQNGVYSSTWNPTLAAGRAFPRFAVMSNLGGILPTAKIWSQGRAIEWNTTVQVHAPARISFDIENNATYFYGGPSDGQTQNFITPAAIYVVHRPNWGPEHSGIIFISGMQIATSRYHQYNHNLVTEMLYFF
jgi:hypothetical protein